MTKYYDDPARTYGNTRRRRRSDTASAPDNRQDGELNPINDANRPAEGFRRTFKNPDYRRSGPSGAAGSESLDDAVGWACGL